MTREILNEYREVWERTEGWLLWPAAAIWDSLLDFQERDGIRGDLIEIGVYHGMAAALLLMMTCWRCESEGSIYRPKMVQEDGSGPDLEKALPVCSNWLSFPRRPSGMALMATMTTVPKIRKR